jgi:hypothetical protein
MFFVCVKARELGETFCIYHVTIFSKHIKKSFLVFLISFIHLGNRGLIQISAMVCLFELCFFHNHFLSLRQILSIWGSGIYFHLVPHPVVPFGDNFSNPILPKEPANPRPDTTCKGWKDAYGSESHLPQLSRYVACNPLDRISSGSRRESSIELKLASVINNFMFQEELYVHIP